MEEGKDDMGIERPSVNITPAERIARIVVEE